MMHQNRQIRTAWLIGGGIESLSAATYLIRDAEVPGEKIHILDLQPQPKYALENSVGIAIEGSITAELIESTHFDCIWRHLRKPCESHDDVLCLEFKQQNESSSRTTRTAVEAFMSKPANFMDSVDRRLLWKKNRKLTINALVHDETSFEQKSIDEVFDSSFWGSGLWEKASRYTLPSAYPEVSRK